jgi:hypothetical protein
MVDAPLMLQIAQLESAGVDPHDPEVELTITNSTNKPVSTYAIKYEVVLNGQLHPGGLELNNISSARSLLQPGETRTATIGGVHYSLPIERIVVSIDFLEFTDDTTWGADTYSSAEVLAGMRVGARTAAENLLRSLTAQGSTTFAERMERAADVVSLPDGHSGKWREGFHRGAAFITERAKHEIRDSSAAEIERVLRLPIDALDEIKRSKR